jgi:2-polyprenyl-6-methoxyphenol hydroxylase-like FAD-dependent oxidoreductase
MSEGGRFDVIVIGARCAGSPLATFLQRAGLSVCVIDQADFPSDTLSTHMFQVGGIEVLESLGVLSPILATGAPPITSCHMQFEDVDLSGPPRVKPGDLPVPLLCVRRISLDVHLVEMASAAGVEMRLKTRATGLIWHDKRVIGVQTTRRNVVENLYADLVVGADGRNSPVARMVGSRRYHVLPSERMSSWAYFRQKGSPVEPKIYYHRRGDDFIVAAPADDGLFLVATCPSIESFDSYQRDSEREFQRAVQGCRPVADLLSGMERMTKFRGLLRFEGYFREASGPGWVLVGDSGHFKDPTPGQGISDALRQVSRLQKAICRGLSGTQDLDSALQSWWKWRDRDALQHYWFCSDVGKRGPISPVRLEILRKIAQNDELRMDFLDIFLHRRYPRQLFGPAALVAGTARLLMRQPGRGATLGEAYRILSEDVDRRIQALRPRYTSSVPVDQPHFDHQPAAQSA